MAERERKNRQCNGRKRRDKQTRQWPKEKGQRNKTMAEREGQIDNAMAERKRTNRQDNVGQNTTQKTKEQYEPQYNWA